VSLILVIGGYGGFGARLCRRLSAAGHELIVAGRDPAKAQLFCQDLPRARPLAMDRNGDVGAVLARERPALVIDAAGPFQGSSYHVPIACIRARLPYLDLADAREFVVGIGLLDEAARDAAVPIISGASSVPALSGAVTRALADGMEHVHAVDVALSASNRASGGASVIAAILSYVGRPVQLWRGRRWALTFGWQELRREDFLLSDGSGIPGRLVALADVPDADLLPPMLPGEPAVTFRAGTELRFQMLVLWLASWPVRWGWLRSLVPFGPRLLRLYRLTLGLGGARSAMSVTLWGQAGEDDEERRWVLVAEEGDGLEVPTLAAALLAEDVLAGDLPSGAYSAGTCLQLERFGPAFGALRIRHETQARRLPPPVYARVLGDSWSALPPAVRTMHQVRSDAGAEGEGRVQRGGSWPARLVATLMRFPPTGTWPLHVAFAERNGVETWTRDFGGHRFRSRLGAAGEQVEERFGPLRFRFDLPAGPEGLAMHLRSWSVFGLDLPLKLAPRIAAREWEEEGRFRFYVDVAMPVIGPVIRYSGWLVRSA
jgi:hypothetical protein